MTQQKTQAVSAIDALSVSPDVTLVAGPIKAAMRLAGGSSRDLWAVPRAQIRVLDGFNVRIKNASYDAHIAALAHSMKTDGFKAEFPLSGYVARDGADSVIYITDGHCRLAGADLAISQGAEIDVLPIVVASQSRDLQDLTAGLVLSNSGKPLEPLEKAAVCKRLALFGWTEGDIAKRLNFSANYVRDLLLLAGSPLAVRELVAQEKLSATAAIQMLVKHGDKAVAVITQGLEKAAASGKTKVTGRFMASDQQAKFVKRSAPELFDTVKAVVQDPGYASLDPELRTKIDAVLSAIQKSKDKDKVLDRPIVSRAKKEKTK